MSISPDQTYLARTFDDERYTWARTLRVRRRAVLAEVALFVALLAATLASAATDQGWTTTHFVVWTVGMLGFIPLHSVLNLGIRGVLDRDRRSLDEHQRRGVRGCGRRRRPPGARRAGALPRVPALVGQWSADLLAPGLDLVRGARRGVAAAP